MANRPIGFLSTMTFCLVSCGGLIARTDGSADSSPERGDDSSTGSSFGELDASGDGTSNAVGNDSGSGLVVDGGSAVDPGLGPCSGPGNIFYITGREADAAPRGPDTITGSTGYWSSTFFGDDTVMRVEVQAPDSVWWDFQLGAAQGFAPGIYEFVANDSINAARIVTPDVTCGDGWTGEVIIDEIEPGGPDDSILGFRASFDLRCDADGQTLQGCVGYAK